MPIHQLISSSFLFVGKNTDKGNIFCRGPTIDSIYLFSAMLINNSRFSPQKLKQGPYLFHFQGNFAI